MDVYEILETILERISPSIDSIYILVILLLIFLFLNKLDFSFDKTKEKVMISYLILGILKVLNIVPIIFIIPITLIIYFIFMEVIKNNAADNFNLYKGRFYFYDFIYKLIFEYHYLEFIILLVIVSSKINNLLCEFLRPECSLIVQSLLGLIVYAFILKKVFQNKFNTYPLYEIKNMMTKILPFEEYHHDKRLEEFGIILTHYEDRSFFSRMDNYNPYNFEFFKYKYNRVKDARKSKIYSMRIIGTILKHFVTILVILYKLILALIRHIKKLSKKIFRTIKKKDKIYSIRSLVRGYSTIEMQLIRTLALKDGYTRWYQRKFYEIIYSQIFFKSLKEYYKYYKYNNISEFKYYILEIYINCARTFINEKAYKNINELYKNRRNIYEITNEEFFIYTLGLANRRISIEAVLKYYRPIELDEKLLEISTNKVLNQSFIYNSPDKDGLPIRFIIFNNKNMKRYEITMKFNSRKTLKEICNYFRKVSCEHEMEVYIDNLKDIIYGQYFEKDLLEKINFGLDEYYNLLSITVNELYEYCSIQSKTIELTCNIGLGIGGEFAREDGIIYSFNNNEKAIHAHLPHVNCITGDGEEIRINLLNYSILDNKGFKSPTKTKQAKKFVKNHQEELLRYWDEVVDKDNVYNKKINNNFRIGEYK